MSWWMVVRADGGVVTVLLVPPQPPTTTTTVPQWEEEELLLDREKLGGFSTEVQSHTHSFLDLIFYLAACRVLKLIVIVFIVNTHFLFSVLLQFFNYYYYYFFFHYLFLILLYIYLCATFDNEPYS